MASRVISYNRMDGVDASHGQKFEMDMTTLVYLRCQRLHEKWKREGTSGIKSFAVANNVEGAGQFDDIVVGLEYVDNEVIKNKLLLVQCKHVENTQKNSHDRFKNYLCDQKELDKYLKSYNKIEQCRGTSKEQNNLSSLFTGENLDIEVIFYSNFNIFLNDFETNFFQTNKPICKESDIATEIFNSSKSEQFELKLKENCSFGTKQANQNEKSFNVKHQFCEKFRIFFNQSEPESLFNKEIKALTNNSGDLEYLRDSLVQEVKLNFISQKVCFALTESDNLLQDVRNYCDLKREGEAVLKQFRSNYSRMNIFSDIAIENYQKLIHSHCCNTIRTEYEKLEELKFMQFFCTKAEGATFFSINDSNDKEKLISSRKTRLYENLKQVYIYSKHFESFEKETLKRNDVVIQLLKHSDQQQMTLEKYMNQLSKETEHCILNTKVCFQGTSTDIQSLCGDDWKMVFDEKSVCDILETKLLEIGTSLPTLDFYVQRTFKKEILGQEYYKERTKTWNINSDCIILFTEKNESIPYHDASYKVFLNRKEMRTFVHKLVEENKDKLSYHLCSHTNEQFQLIYSFGKKSSLTKEHIIGEDALTNKTKDKISILSDVAGMGKTTTLLSLARKYKEANPSHWVSFLELNKYLDFFKKVHEFPSTEFAVHFIGSTLLNLKVIELLLFTKACESGNSALFFDAFDEISPDAEGSFPLLLLALEKTRIRKIVVSCRPNFTSSLEEKLLLKSKKFQGLTTEEKNLALEGYWKQMLKKDEQIIEGYLLKKVAKETVALLQLEEKFFSEILAIPLQIRMVAIVYYELLTNINSEEHVGYLSSINLADLFEQFINLHAERFYVDKHKMEWNNIKSDQKKRFLQDKLKGAEEIACRIIIPEVLRNDLLGRQEEISALCDDVGIITHKSPVVFLHRTVAEYLAAKYLVRKILCQRNSDDTRIVAYILVDDKFNIVRRFINSLLIGSKTDIFFHYQTKEIKIIREISKIIPIYVSVTEGNMEIFRLMASNIALLNMRNLKGMTALHRACNKGQTEAAKLLLSSDCSVNIRDNDGDTVLHTASSKGDIEVMQLIFKRDTSLLNMQNKRGFTPLFEACFKGKSEAAKFLLSISDCSVNIRDNDHDTVLHAASLIGDIEVMQLILQLDSSLLNMQNKNGDTPLYTACYCGNTEAAKLLLFGNDCSVIIRDNDHNNVLHAASSEDHIEVMQLILQRDSSLLNMQNKNGFTPLYTACFGGNTEAAKLLLYRNDCSVIIRDNDHNNVLHTASYGGETDVMQLILQRDISLLNMRNMFGFPPLHAACEMGHTKAVKLLLSFVDCSVNIRDNDGNTVLHFASRQGDIEIMQLILERDISLLNMQNKRGFIPFV